MEIKKTISNNLYTNFGKQQTQQNAAAANNSEYADKKAAPTNAGLYQAYNNVSFKGKPYDGTNFRTDLQNRAEHSSTKLKLYPNLEFVKKDNKYVWDTDTDNPVQELELFKTKHSEYVQSSDGTKIYKIRYVEDKDRIVQQVMASKLYNSVGVRTPEYIAFEKNGKTGYLVEVLEEELFDAETNPKALYESFVADVWLGNRNGLSKGNTKIDKDGTPVKMSVSGSLNYRASGKPKDKRLDYGIKEIHTMRDYSINPDAAKALAQMSDDELYEAIETFCQKYDYKNVRDIIKDYDSNQPHDLSNVLNNRQSALKYFIHNDKEKKTLEKRGLLQEGTPSLPNLRKFDPNFDIATRSALEITDEQWETLKQRGLFNKHSWLKPLGMLDYKYLARMDEEQHLNALKRGIYAHCKQDDGYHDIGGAEIEGLSKFTDEQWTTIQKRNLLEAKMNYNIREFWLQDFIEKVIGIDDYNWDKVVQSNIMETGCSPDDIHNFIALANSKETQNFYPSVETRVRRLANIEKGAYSINRRFEAKYILKLAALDNSQWERIMEVTQDLSDVKMMPDSLLEIANFDEDVYKTLKKRNLLTTTEHSYGLKDIALLSDEDWENVQKRKEIKELYPNAYKDWAYLASLTDEEYQIALDRHLFDNRAKDGHTRRFDGDDIAKIVTTLNDEDWKNVDKRGLFKDYRMFDGWSSSEIGSYEFIHLSKMTDTEFEKFEKVSGAATMYPETKIQLTKMPEIQYQRLFDRKLFQYINSYESWDNWSEDYPVMSALSELSDEDYAAFKAQKNDCKTIAAKILIIKADKIGLDKKHSLNELSLKEKREYLQLLLTKGGVLVGKDFHNNYNVTEIIPKDANEYVEILNKLIKSVGIDVRPLEESEKADFFNALNSIAAPNSEFKSLNLKALDFKLNTKYPRSQFIADISSILQNIDEAEKAKVYDYFGFELHQHTDNSTRMSGYPSNINNGEKLKEIKNEQTKEVIEKIRPFVKNFTSENAVLPDGKYVSPQLAQDFNNILKALPELYSIIGKKQHGTHDYTVDVHTLAVLQECVNNEYFNTLNNQEKQELMLAALMHDITKEEKQIDKSHPKNSSYDAYFILEKFGLSKQEQLNIYQLIKNHDMLEQCNKPTIDPKTGERRSITEEEQNKLVKNYAFELRSDNLAELECMLTRADLLSVQRNGAFYDKYKNELYKVGRKLQKEVKEINKNAIALPQTRIPKASNIKADGVNIKEIVSQDKDGNEIKNKVVYMSKGLDLSKYGFDKGVNDENFNVIVHGFDNEIQQTILNALDIAEQEALLSASYVVYSKGNYHTFRPQGFILDVPHDNIGAAYYRDFGSGCKKTKESLINDYINGSAFTYRSYVPQLIKQELNLSDQEYIELYKEIKNKPLDVLEREKPHVAAAVKKIFEQMEVHKRKFQRNYNEILVTKNKPCGVFFVGKKQDGNRYEAQDIPENLRKYAQDNDLPIIYFGE